VLNAGSGAGADVVMTGVQSGTSAAPREGVGAQWSLLSTFANGQSRRIVGGQVTGASEFYDVQEVVAADPSNDSLSAAGSTYDARRGGLYDGGLQPLRFRCRGPASGRHPLSGKSPLVPRGVSERPSHPYE